MNRILRITSFSLGVGLLLISLLIDPLHGKPLTIGYYQIILLASAILFILLGIFQKQPVLFLQELIGPLLEWKSRSGPLSSFWCDLFSKRSAFGLIFILFVLILGLNQKFPVTIITEYQDYVGATIPISMLQILVAIGVLLIFFLPILLIEKKGKGWLFDLFFVVVIFFVALYFWNRLPIATNNFTRYIEGQGIFYPFSDSRKYDMNALAMLIGQGLGYGTPVQHPFYTFFVAILHAILGQDYSLLFKAQIVVYALFPGIIYLLGKNIHKRFVGLVAALLVFFHEFNLIRYGSTYTLVNAQMMVSEAFITLLFGLMMLVTYNWIEKKQTSGGPLLTGVVLGLASLVRTQALILVFVFLFYFVIRKIQEKNYSFRPFIFLVTGLMIVILPWMTRNWVRNGNFAMEDMRYVKNILTVNGSKNGSTDASVVQFDEKGRVDLINSFTGESGRKYYRRTAVFFLNSTIHTLYQLPFSLKVQGVDSYIENGPGQYPIPFLHLSIRQWIVALLQILIIAIGASSLYKRAHLAGLLPLIVFFFYNLSSAMIGYSGFRFVQPVEWIFLIYWAVGVSEILLWAFRIAEIPSHQTAGNDRRVEFGWRPAFAIAAFLGLLLPVSEAVIPVHQFPQIDASQAAKDGWQENKLLEGNFVEISGQALYPILFTNKEQFSLLRNADYGVYPQYYEPHLEWDKVFIREQLNKSVPVLIFQLGNNKMHDVILTDPIITGDAINPFNFQVQDVTLVGCDMGDHIEAYSLYFPHENIEEINAGGILPSSCPK